MNDFCCVDRRMLKVLAIITMLMDHIGLLWGIEPFRAVGRMAFPLYAFLLLEGFYHTHDVLSYIYRIARVSVFAQIPYMLMKSDPVTYGICVPAILLACFDMTLPLGFLLPLVLPTAEFNVLYLFAWGVMLFAYLDAKEKEKAAKAAGKLEEKPLHMAISLCVWVGAIPVMLRSDYSIVGMALFLVMYYCRKKGYVRVAFGTAVWGALVYWIGTLNAIYMVGALGGAMLLAFYDDREVRLPKWLSRLDYAFYPVHMLVLWFLHEYSASLLF